MTVLRFFVHLVPVCLPCYLQNTHSTCTPVTAQQTQRKFMHAITSEITFQLVDQITWFVLQYFPAAHQEPKLKKWTIGIIVYTKRKQIIKSANFSSTNKWASLVDYKNCLIKAIMMVILKNQFLRLLAVLWVMVWLTMVGNLNWKSIQKKKKVRMFMLHCVWGLWQLVTLETAETGPLREWILSFNAT